MSVQLAKQVFGVPRTLARLDEPGRADSYQALDIDYVAGAKLTANVIFERIVEKEFRYHVTFSGGDVEVVEMTLGARAGGVTVDDFEVQDQLRVAAVRRAGRTYVPGSDFKLREGDLVVAAARTGVRERILRYLKRGDER
jgi:Trk K+ transport system NAD-binding subunit